MPVDAHQHFWRYSEEAYPWISAGMERLRRDFLPEDLRPLLQSAGLDGCIAVQARQNLEESHWLLELADQSAIIRGVVGWLDLQDPAVERQLGRFAAHPRFVGVRHVVQDEPDDRFLVRPEFVRGLRALQQFRLTYDLLIYPHQLPAAIELVRKLPEQPFVLDHLAKPKIGEQLFEPWRAWIAELARAPNVLCKVSGMVTEAAWRAWRHDDFRPYLDVVYQAFGDDRLMFGSDWPVCLLAAEYPDVVDIVRRFFGSADASIQRKIFGGNALRFYIAPKG